MEGHTNVIQLKGIVRNTAQSASGDGELDDVLNIHFKDGSWRPIDSAHEVSGLAQYGEVYDYIFIHQNGYKHAIGAKEGVLEWFATWDDAKQTFVPNTRNTKVLNIVRAAKDIQVVSVGNLICVKDDELHHFVYTNALLKYETLYKDYNGAANSIELNPEGWIDFWVEDALENGEQKLYATSATHSLPDNTDKIGDEKVFIYNKTQFNIAYAPLLAKAKYEAKKGGMLVDGYHYLMYAFKTTSGDYAFYSRPILLSPSMIGHEWFSYKSRKHNNETNDEKDGFNFTNLGNFTSGNTYPVCSGNTTFTIDTDTYSDVKSIFNNGGFTTLGGKEHSFCPTAVYNGVASADTSYWNNVRVFGNPRGRGICENMYVFYNHRKVYIAIGGSTLKCRFGKTIDKRYLNGIVSVDVFITSGVSHIYEDLSEVNKFNSIKSYENIYGYIDYDYTDNAPSNYPPNDHIVVVGNDNVISINNSNGARPSDVNDSVLGANYNYACVYIPFRNFLRPFADVKKELDENLLPFYHIQSIPVESIKAGITINIDLKSGSPLTILEARTTLPYDSYNSRGNYNPKGMFMYNGRLHIFNYDEYYFRGFPLNYFQQHQVPFQWEVQSITTRVNDPRYPSFFVEVTMQTDNGEVVVSRRKDNDGNPVTLTSLSPMLSYPDTRATKMRIVVNGTDQSGLPKRFDRTFTLKPILSQNVAAYFNPDFKPIHITLDKKGYAAPSGEKNISYNYSNRLKVSETSNPIYFPNANVYQIGNTEIIGLAANEIAVGQGQAGDAPLYAFTKDGIYALYVDTSGRLVYSFSRPVARDVCNNPDSILSIDGGVLFSTDRGLMLLRGSNVVELSENIEGCVRDYFTPDSLDYVKQIAEATSHKQLYVCQDRFSKVEFIEYLKGAKVAYNHNEREVIVSNDKYPYSYIYKDKYWSKVAYSSHYFVRDYPVVYSVDSKNRRIYNLDQPMRDGNNVVLLTRAIKFGTQEFKNGFRCVVRGRFNTLRDKTDNRFDYSKIKTYKNGELIDWSKVRILHYDFDNEVILTISFPKCQDVGLCVKPQINIGFDQGDAGTYTTNEYTIQLNQDTTIVMHIPHDDDYTDAIVFGNAPMASASVSSEVEEFVYNGKVYDISEAESRHVADIVASIDAGAEEARPKYLGLYVFGSYDCKRWKLLGANERTGTFRDIGCKVERVDCKYFKILLIGSMATESSLEYIEFSAKSRLLADKIR